eukprot:TRINITY_DN47493_c0_g1_i1.p1 TRINITY_DN47493_c0_g1~~TRINITY_DN47493_c0_g1_i1.p1  ORF type:complete len:136 (+),score=15.21 TRINITY_DN47493_c0_g1_i1:63-470(+)
MRSLCATGVWSTFIFHVLLAEDMNPMFAKFSSCKECVNAGHGWCPQKNMCGGFANRECGEEVGSTHQELKEDPVPAPEFKDSSRPAGDMSSTFAKFSSCKECIAAGFGWCPQKLMCGGFANQECGEEVESTHQEL